MKRIKIKGQRGCYIITEAPYPELGDEIEGLGYVVSVAEEEGMVIRFSRAAAVDKSEPDPAENQNEAKP